MSLNGRVHRRSAAVLTAVIALTGAGFATTQTSASATHAGVSASVQRAPTTLRTARAAAAKTRKSPGWKTCKVAAASAVAATVDPSQPEVVKTARPSCVAPFAEVGIAIRKLGSSKALFVGCAFIARTQEQWNQGLMGRKDLGGYDAMVFAFPTDVSYSFFMRTVPVGLSIAWFSADGAFVSSAEMAPCGDRDDCPLYGAKGPYRFAVETPIGGLPRLSIGADTQLVLTGPCNR